jgi:hypothetical protein
LRCSAMQHMQCFRMCEPVSDIDTDPIISPVLMLI